MRTHINPFTRSKAEVVFYHIQTKEQMQLKSAVKWDILANMQDVANHELHKFNAVTEENYYHRWNQLMKFVKSNKRDINAERVLVAMYQLDRKESITLWGDQSEDDLRNQSKKLLIV